METSLAAGQAAFAAQFVDPDRAKAWYSGLADATSSFAGNTALEVRTRYPGDRRTSVDHFTVELAGDGRIDSVVSPASPPLWSLAVVTRTPAKHGTVLAVGLTPAQQQLWAARLDRASAVVAASPMLSAGSDWDGGLVVMLPDNAAAFTGLTGADAGDTGAVTTCATGTPRIVVSPAAVSRQARWLQTTLIHEAVHVATDSPCGHGVGWIVEGVAESVAAASDTATAASNAALVRHFLRDKGVPSALPKQVSSATDYAMAQAAVDQVRARLGTTAAAAFLARGIAGQLSEADLARARGWYIAELQRRTG